MIAGLALLATLLATTDRENVAVAIAVPHERPARFELKPLGKALDLYLQEYAREVMEVETWPTDESQALASVRDAAAARGARIAVWYLFSGASGDPRILVQALDTSASPPKVLALLIRYRKEDWNLYRTVALKTKSLVTALRAVGRERPTVADVQPPEEITVDEAIGVEDPRSQFIIEAIGGAAIPSAPRTSIALGVGIGGETERWQYGLEGIYGRSSRDDSWRVAASLRRELWNTSSFPIALGFQAGATAFGFSAPGTTRLSSGPIPFCALTAGVARALSGNVSLQLEARLDILLSTTTISRANKVVFASDSVSPGLALKVRFAL